MICTEILNLVKKYGVSAAEIYFEIARYGCVSRTSLRKRFPPSSLSIALRKLVAAELIRINGDNVCVSGNDV